MHRLLPFAFFTLAFGFKSGAHHPHRHHHKKNVQVPSISSLIPLPEDVMSLVAHNARNVSLQSWELGVMSMAFLEFDWPQLSVFGSEGVPPPGSLYNNNGADNISTVIDIANYVIDTRPAGCQTLMPDSAVGDPASLAAAVLLANYTQPSNPKYNTPLQQQLDFLLYEAPRNDDGAISHRTDQVQLWADFIYMAPPVLALYGAFAQPEMNGTLLYMAYDQICLYKNHLFDESVGLWKHIMLGSYQDENHWGTGNGWAAAGMLRVLATLNQTNYGYEPQFARAQVDLANWATDIVNSAWTYQNDDGSLNNYITNNASFHDSSSTTLLAYATFRLAALPAFLRGPQNDTAGVGQPDWNDSVSNMTFVELSDSSLQAALRGRDYVRNKLNHTTGWLSEVVDPYSFDVLGTRSPEAQSFVMLMEAAWADWTAYVSPQQGSDN